MQQGRVKEAIDKSPPAVAKGNFQAEEWQRAVPYRGGIGGRRVKFKRTRPPFPGLPVPGQVDQWVSRAKARWSVGEMGFEKNGHQLKETKDRSGPWPRAQEVQTLEVSISMPCATDVHGHFGEPPATAWAGTTGRHWTGPRGCDDCTCGPVRLVNLRLAGSRPLSPSMLSGARAPPLPSLAPRRSGWESGLDRLPDRSGKSAPLLLCLAEFLFMLQAYLGSLLLVSHL